MDASVGAGGPTKFTKSAVTIVDQSKVVEVAKDSVAVRGLLGPPSPLLEEDEAVAVGVVVSDGPNPPDDVGCTVSVPIGVWRAASGYHTADS